MIEIIQSIYNPERGWYIRRKNKGYSAKFLHKDFTWHCATGYCSDYKYSGEAPGYYPTQAIAQAYLDEYLRRESHKIKNLAIAYGMGKTRLEQLLRKEQKMMKLSNGVEISEDTVVSALKKVGINVEPSKPKHIFKAGDMAKSGNFSNSKRIILLISGLLRSFDLDGYPQSTGQNQFESCGYEFIGKLTDFIK